MKTNVNEFKFQNGTKSFSKSIKKLFSVLWWWVWNSSSFYVFFHYSFRFQGANYLDLQLLVEMTCKTVADLIRDKTPEQVRQTFRLVNDLPPPPPIPEVFHSMIFWTINHRFLFIESFPRFLKLYQQVKLQQQLQVPEWLSVPTSIYSKQHFTLFSTFFLMMMNWFIKIFRFLRDDESTFAFTRDFPFIALRHLHRFIKYWSTSDFSVDKSMILCSFRLKKKTIENIWSTAKRTPNLFFSNWVQINFFMMNPRLCFILWPFSEKYQRGKMHPIYTC